MMKQFSGMTPLNAELLRNVQYRKPDVLFDAEHRLDLGGVTVVLRALGPTHTRGDTIACVEQDRVLFAGDIVMSKRFLAFSAQSSGAAWLEGARPARGAPARADRPQPRRDSGTRRLIAQQRAVLQQIQAGRVS